MNKKEITGLRNLDTANDERKIKHTEKISRKQAARNSHIDGSDRSITAIKEDQKA
jgi:hypothetical protein